MSYNGEYLDNTSFSGSHGGNSPSDCTDMINESDDLDDLAEKLTNACLQENADLFMPQEHHKARTSTVVSGMCTLFALIKKNVSNLPIYIIKSSIDCSNVNGYYFFIGTFETIRAKLESLIKSDGSHFGNINLKDTRQW